MRKIALLSILAFLGGCNMLPGMQNPSFSKMYEYKNHHVVQFEPVIIPINPTLLANNPPPPYIYHIAPQDVLSIIVWQHPEFSPPVQSVALVGTQSTQAAGQTGYLVNRNGEIYFPLVGYVSVGGRTMEQAHKIITNRLRQYVKHPEVMLRVADYRSKKVYVIGEVLKPNLLPLNDQPMSITDALIMTGSIDPNAADPSHIYVIRGSYLRPHIYWLNAKTPDALLLGEKFQLQPDDVVYVSSASVSQWNRVLNQILPTLQAVYFTKVLTTNSG